MDWFAVRHGPFSTARALNIGIFLLPEHRGCGYGSTAPAVFADYLFANTLVERLEAGTDVDNIAEQRALERAGFTARESHDTLSSGRGRGTTSSPTAGCEPTKSRDRRAPPQRPTVGSC